MGKHPSLAAVATALALAATGPGDPGAAQTLLGTVVEEGTGRPLEGVRLTVEVPDSQTVIARTITDEDGRFVLNLDGPGSLVLTAELIGYAFFRSTAVDIEDMERVTVQVRMAIEAVPLEPLEVVSRARTSAALRDFYDRMERGRRSGSGRFLDRAEIERRSAFRVSQLLQMMPGVRLVDTPGRRETRIGMVGARGTCMPAMYVDGMHVNRGGAPIPLDQVVNPLEIEGIEVYRGAAHAPGQYDDPSGCGVILVWTRRGTGEGGRPFTWARLLLAVGVAVLVILLN